MASRKWCSFKLLAVSIVVCNLVACAGSTLGTGEGAWHRVETRHFSIHTDLPPARAEARARDLEHLLFGLHQTGWQATGDLPLKLNVVMFRNSVGFEEYGGGKLRGYALSEALFEPWIVLPAPDSYDRLETVAHELTHYMAFQAMQHQPRWFSEGLASYFESARFTDAGTFEIGGVPKARARALQTYGWERPSELLDQVVMSEPQFYGSAWLLVHYLMTVRGDEFAQFQTNLARGLSEVEAWRTAFPQLSRAALDYAVQEYVEVGEYARYTFSLAPPEVQTTLHAMSRADEHALRALLGRTCSRCPQRVRSRWRADVQLALASDPDNVRAVVLTVQDENHDAEQALARARRLVRVRSRDWLAWVALGFAALRAGKYGELVAEPGSDPGLQAPSLAPQQPCALFLRAVSHAARGEREQAIRVSAAAQRMQSTNGALLLARAELLAQLSACASLREVAARIEQLAHLDIDVTDRQRLAKMSMNCQEASPHARAEP